MDCIPWLYFATGLMIGCTVGFLSSHAIQRIVEIITDPLQRPQPQQQPQQIPQPQPQEIPQPQLPPHLIRCHRGAGDHM